MVGVAFEFLRDNAFQFFFDFFRCFSRGKAGAVGDTKDMCVYGYCWLAEGDVQDHICRFASDSGQFDQFFPAIRYPSFVFFDKDAGEVIDVFRFGFVQADSFYVFADCLFSQRDHFFRSVCGSEQCGRGFVYAFIRGLCRQDDCDEQGEGIGIIKLSFRFGVGCLQAREKLCDFLFFHGRVIRVPMEKITYGIHDSALGLIVLGVMRDKLCWLGFMVPPEQGAYKGDGLQRMKGYFPEALFSRDDGATETMFLRVMTAWRTGNAGDVPMDLHGTPFQLSVWNALLEIPKGEVRSYGAIAERLGNPDAARAVGSAVGMNPISLIVPCHRVVQGSGSLGNYGWGVVLKAKILQIENVTHAVQAA